MAINDDDLERLRRCVELARVALGDGDEPFGSILVDGDGATLYEDRNRVKNGDHTRHPEFAIARWAVDNLTPDKRARTTVYTSGEHCPMCAAGHAWVGLGRIVYATSSEQLTPMAYRMGRTAATGGSATYRHRRARGDRRRARTRARRHHENAVRGEVPAMTGSSRERSSMTGSSRERSSMTEPAWVPHAIWWQVYPLGFVGAYPAEPPPTVDEHRLRRIVDWLDYAIELGASGIALGPVFASRTHGYDTTDHYRIDPRLGDDADFDHLIAEAHQRGLRVLLDGVFNHVATDFAHTSWFRKRGNDFDTFEGHGELIALDHDNPDVVAYTVDVMTHWLKRGADGWRLDAAYAVPDRFWSAVLPRVREQFGDAWFVGEVIHGDYTARVRESGFDSVTQYELWKAIWSSLNDGNFHELDWALVRHNEFLDDFVPMTFVGNHDVTRIASQLANTRHLEHALVILFTTGGTPSVYAGDESAYRGVKEERLGGDDAVRPEFTAPLMGVDEHGHDIFRLHQYLIGLRRRHAWLHAARTSPRGLTNTQYVYETRNGDDALLVALNVDDAPLSLSLPELGIDVGQIVAGSGAPPQSVVGEAEIEPHGWLIIAAR